MSNREPSNENHKSIYHEQNRRYYEKHKEHLKALKRANREEVSTYQKAYYEANKDRIAKRRAAYHKANPEKQKLAARRQCLKKYGMTIETLNAMIDSQSGQCLCCKSKFGLLKESQPVVDHCHATGRIRGILCRLCNLTLGHAKDNPKILRACARYLERSTKTANSAESLDAKT